MPGLGAAATAARFSHFYLATSLVYDSFRAGGNAVIVLLLGAPVLGALVRLRRRHSVVIEDSVAADHRRDRGIGGDVTRSTGTQELPVVSARNPNSAVAAAP